MGRKMVSCLVCMYENNVISADFYNDLDESYRELDRQAQDEAFKLAAEGCGPNGMTVIDEVEIKRIVWQLVRDSVLAENPGMPASELESVCQIHATVFHVLFCPIQ